jgi:hypothetical protein
VKDRDGRHRERRRRRGRDRKGRRELRALATAPKMSARAIARVVGVSHTTVLDLISGDTDAPEIDVAFALEEKIGIPARLWVEWDDE